MVSESSQTGAKRPIFVEHGNTFPEHNALDTVGVSSYLLRAPAAVQFGVLRAALPNFPLMSRHFLHLFQAVQAHFFSSETYRAPCTVDRYVAASHNDHGLAVQINVLTKIYRSQEPYT